MAQSGAEEEKHGGGDPRGERVTHLKQAGSMRACYCPQCVTGTSVEGRRRWVSTVQAREKEEMVNGGCVLWDAVLWPLLSVLCVVCSLLYSR